MNNQYDPSNEARDKGNLLTNPLSEYSIPPWLVYLLGLVGLVYILNPTAGILEFIPDNLPIIGNLDEGLAAMLIWAGLLEIVEGTKRRKQKSADQEYKD